MNEKTLSKKCQEDLGFNAEHSDYEKNLKCMFCHNEINQQIDRYTYISSLLPIEDKSISTLKDYQINMWMSVFESEKDSEWLKCGELLNYTTWFIYDYIVFY